MLTTGKVKELREMAIKFPSSIIVESDLMLGLLDEIERLQAQAAVMSTLINQVGNIMSIHAHRCPLHPYTNYSSSEEHLAEYRNVMNTCVSFDVTNAGREMLERIRKLEAVVKEAKVIAKWMKWWLNEDLCDCDTYHICGRPQRERELQSFEQALAELEKGDGKQ